MKSSTRFILSAVAVATLTAGAANIASAAGPGGHGQRGGGERGAMMFEMFDSNGDGSITMEEARGAQAERLASFDTDGSGDLSLAEFEALFLEMSRPRMVDGFQRLDADGDGIVTVEEFNAPVERLARHMGDDGTLDRDDMGQRGGKARHGGERPDRDDN